MNQRVPTVWADNFHRDIISKFRKKLKAGLGTRRIVRDTQVLMQVNDQFLVPRRYVVATKSDNAYSGVKSMLEELGFRREMPSCRHYLLGTIISVKIERPSECEIYENYSRTGEWTKV